ncbi:MAG: MoxR family ATPase [Caldilineae bacterium]|nr:MoxR family ATPase [Chloroflexota bacterium]MCB9176824.1 MoxR family ATPase [Caldilineae bacterium]
MPSEPRTVPEPPMDVERFRASAAAVEAELGRIIVGQDALIRGTLITLLAGGHALLEGVPGLGKTLLVRSLARAIGARFSRIQFTPDLMPADIVGTTIIAEDEAGRRAWRYEPGPLFANLVLADEINRASPKTQSALLEAMQERSVTVAGTTRPLPEPFLVLATQNPIEMEGTYPLPEAQLDRFLMHLRVPFPDRQSLVAIAERGTGDAVDGAGPVVDLASLVAMQGLARALPIAPHVSGLAADLVLATHPEAPGAPESLRRYVAYGASPRAAQALVSAGKVRALLEGRFNVAAEDLVALAPAVLRHRLVPSYEARAEGLDMDALVRQLVATLRDAQP